MGAIVSCDVSSLHCRIPIEFNETCLRCLSMYPDRLAAGRRNTVAHLTLKTIM